MMSDSRIMTVERVNEQLVSSKESLAGESVDLTGHEKTVMDGKRDPGKNTDQFYKLIEYDGGIPFHLIFGKDPEDDFYILTGNGIENITGIKSSELNGERFRKLVEEVICLSHDTPSDYCEIRRRMLSGDITGYKIEIRLSPVSGKSKWVRETTTAVKDETTGKITGMIGILHDISDVKRVMSYLKEAGDYEGENERLKTAFLQNISHEVRTPLNAIVGFSTLLCESQEGYHSRKEFARMLNSSTDRFLEVMDNIMEIARIEADASAVNLNDVNLSLVVNRVTRTFNKRAEERGLSLICNIPETDFTIVTDSYKLMQTINNLMENALKFTPAGKVEFGFKKNGASVEFYVADTGIGIADEHKELIFNKFYQVDSGSTRLFPGMGLGLSIAKAYVEMLGGSIKLVSKTGEGSTFRFSLPIR